MMVLKNRATSSHQGNEGDKQDDATPVGVTIAFQQHRRLNPESGPGILTGHDNDEPTSRTMGPRNSATRRPPLSPIKHTRRSPRRRAGKITKPVSSWTVFLEGASLYLACLVLPALVGTLWHYFGNNLNQQKQPQQMYSEPQIDRTTLYDSASELVQSSLEYLCHETPHDENGDESWSSWLWSQSGSASMASYICPMVLPPPPPPEEPGLYSPDTSSFHNDVWMVALAAICLAAFRLLLIQWIVTPLQSTDQLVAMVRCKSIHLLSADYSQTPAATPVSSRRRKPMELLDHATAGGLDTSALVIPDLSAPITTTSPTKMYNESRSDAASEYSDLGLGIDETEREDEEPMGISIVPAVFSGVAMSPSVGHKKEEDYRSLGGEENYNDGALVEEDEQEEQGILIWDDLAARLGADEVVGTDTLEATPQPFVNSVFAAPRYATALFRLFYCTVASFLALYCFHDANFWPWYVGGKGSTANCWDLSGGLTVGMDSDFDHQNAVLKHYFLWQASYHWHSGAFHILSMLLLLLHPPVGKAAAAYTASPTDSPTAAGAAEAVDKVDSSSSQHWRFGALKTNSSTYVRSLLQHVLALGLISTAYVFSSLRRLSAIGMFAFDVSSWFLHLLQVCINAPDLELVKPTKGKKRRNLRTLLKSWYRWLGIQLRRPQTISRIHRYLVLPSFCYTRLFVWPALWYSCMFESSHWLQQLEQTLWPGSAQQLKLIFHMWLALLLGMTAVYFRRLIYHPHLQRIQEWVREEQGREEDFASS